MDLPAEVPRISSSDPESRSNLLRIYAPGNQLLSSFWKTTQEFCRGVVCGEAALVRGEPQGS